MLLQELSAQLEDYEALQKDFQLCKEQLEHAEAGIH